MQKTTDYKIEIKQVPKVEWKPSEYKTINITDKIQNLELVATHESLFTRYLINPLTLSSILADTLNSEVVLVYTDHDLGESTTIKLGEDFQENVILRIKRDLILSSDDMLPILIDNISEFLSNIPSIEMDDLSNDEILEKFSHNKSYVIKPLQYE